jgi:hypothetical protein
MYTSISYLTIWYWRNGWIVGWMFSYRLIRAFFILKYGCTSGCVWDNKRVYHHLLPHQYSLKYNPLQPHFFLVTSPIPKISLLFVLPYLHLCFRNVVTKSKRNQSGGGNVLTGGRTTSAMKKLPKPITEKLKISRWPKKYRTVDFLKISYEREHYCCCWDSSPKVPAFQVNSG